MVLHASPILRDYIREDLLVDIPCGKPSLQPGVWIGVFGIVAEVVGFDGLSVLVVFVVSRPDDDAGVGVETVDVVGCFEGDGVAEGWDVGGVVPAAEGEVLPDEDTELVADVVEGVLFVDTTGPDTSVG